MKLEPDFFFTSERHRAARQGGKERQRDFAIRRGTMSVKLGLRAEFSLYFFFFSLSWLFIWFLLLLPSESSEAKQLWSQDADMAIDFTPHSHMHNAKMHLHTLELWLFGLYSSSVHHIRACRERWARPQNKWIALQPPNKLVFFPPLQYVWGRGLLCREGSSLKHVFPCQKKDGKESLRFD